MKADSIHSDILRYIIEHGYRPGSKLPTIQQISRSMDVSVAKVRESLEVARILGMVEIKPGRGTRVAPFRFSHAAALSALYAIGLDAAHFQQLGETRKALEIQFWDQAVTLLTREDIVCLRDLIAAAHDHLMSEPIVVPAREHRAFHLTIFSHLDNLFVLGLLEAFWDAYEAFGLNLYRALDYHQTVWDYHRRMVDAIEAGEFEFGRQLLIEHMNLIRYRSQHTIHPPSSRTEGVNDIQFE